MKKYFCALLLLATAIPSPATMVVGPWMPVFKGIEHAVGTNFADAAMPRLQVVHCMRVDLTDPDVQLFTTPPASNYVAESRETYSLSVSNFLKNNGLKVAADANFYNPGDPSAEGIPSVVYGLQVCTGAVVSAQDGHSRYAAIMFTTNKSPIFVFNNTPPGTNTEGIYTAVTGFYPVVSNGVNFGTAASNSYPDVTIHRPQPRTAFGVSQDKRYLFMMTIDGRQAGYSDGATDPETATWMLQFGAWDAINMDGGGSTAMYMADNLGDPVAVNHSSYVVLTGGARERYVGSHFGVFAKPLIRFINDLVVTPGATTALITWTTTNAANSRVAYGLTPSYGNSTVLDPTLVTNHSVSLSGLTPATTYYFQAISENEAGQFTADFLFTTTNNAVITSIFGFDNVWKYSASGLDGVNWTARGYDDSDWSSGPGVLWTDTRTPPPAFALRATQMPINPVTTYPYTTYYFRTHFTVTNGLAGGMLTFSNYIDDGAIFYLNGVEIRRIRMAASPPAVTNATQALDQCGSNPSFCPFAFGLSGDQLTNVVLGDNVLAVEIHNYLPTSADLLFGAVLTSIGQPPMPALPFVANLAVAPGDTQATITWTTRSNASSRVEYGLTPSLGTFTPLDSAAVTNHSVVLTGLQPLTNYYFRVLSTYGGVQYTASNTFSTLAFYRNLLNVTNQWRYTTNRLDGVNWQSSLYDDSGWAGPAPALLFVGDNPDVNPKNTLLPGTSGMLPPTYYFRTHFTVSNTMPGLALVFSNFIDDGAVFYLNGAEIQRLRMPAPPQTATYTTLATGTPPFEDAIFPDVFRISGDLMTNLLSGDNVLAAEVHQNVSTSLDIVCGSSVGYVQPLASETKLTVTLSGGVICIQWAGSTFTLQQSSTLGSTNSWSDVAGPVTSAPYCTTNPAASRFFRLRN